MTDIGLIQLGISLVPTLGLFWLAWLWSGSPRELVIATARMVVQLLAIGFVLVSIFGAQSPLVGLGVVAVMIAVSAMIAVRVVQENRPAALGRAVVALGIGGGLVLVFVLVAVLQLHDPFYQPRVIIPIAGMVFSNAMTAITLAAERLATELEAGHEFGDARRAAWRAALIPQINSLLAVGLVALPGMMTGQILSGVDPLIAVRYQIVVMAMVLQSAGYSVALYLWLAGRGRPAAD
ncbi:MAG: ABC transporter permease [Marinibacterium sp.]